MGQLVADFSCGVHSRTTHVVRSTTSPTVSPPPSHALARRTPSSSAALLDSDRKKSLKSPILPLPPSRSLIPPSLKFLWFGGGDGSSTFLDENQQTPALSDIDFSCSAAKKNTDLPFTYFVAAEESEPRASNVLQRDGVQELEVETSQKAPSVEPTAHKLRFSSHDNYDARGEKGNSILQSSWIARLLQAGLSFWNAAEVESLESSKDILDNTSSDGETDIGRALIDNYSQVLRDIDVPGGRDDASDSCCNKFDEKTGKRSQCRCMSETREKLEHDHDSLSSCIHEVPVEEVVPIAKLCLLSNLAYVIPKLQSEDLLRDHHLTFVTSSIRKKELAKAHISSRRVTAEAVKQDIPAKKRQKFEMEGKSAASGDEAYVQIFDKNTSVIDCVPQRDSVFEVGTFSQNSSKKGRESFKKSRKQAVFQRPIPKPHGSCPCEWFICDDDSSDTRYLTIQGSESLASWQTNLAFDPIKFEGMAGVLVHRGVYEAAQGLYKVVVRELAEHTRKGSRARLSFTGHSLGGSLATLIAMMLVRRGAVEASAVESVVTLGAPCVLCADERLLKRLHLCHRQFVNVVMHRDIVPRIFACDYPLHVVRLLRRLHGAFRDHPCLHFQNALYSPIGQMMMLQPSKTQSPSHPLLPPHAGLYFIKYRHPEQDELLRVREAQRAFLNTPHPLEVLADFGAYGFTGAISRDHDPRSYRQAINTILALGLRRLHHTASHHRRVSLPAPPPFAQSPHPTGSVRHPFVPFEQHAIVSPLHPLYE